MSELEGQSSTLHVHIDEMASEAQGSVLPSTARWGANPVPPKEIITTASSNDGSAITSEHDKLTPRKKVVLDSGAIILGGRIERLGDQFWTVQNVLSEIRDENSRLALSTLPFDIQIREVDPNALAFVTQFSKLTGDFTRLSQTDLKVIALTYQLEKEFNGDGHLKSKPLPIRPSVTNKTSTTDSEQASIEATHTEAADNAEESESKQDGFDESKEPSQQADVDEGDERANSEEDENSSEIDPNEFERIPLHSLSLSEGGWEVKSNRPREGSEASFSISSSKSKTLPPGWYEGEEDDKGWITPDNCREIAAQGCEKPTEDDGRHVACATTDFAMQNVLLQIGLRVLNMEGLVVKQVKQYVLKCHGCFKICHDATKLFCPSCGNATLMRVAMYVHDDGKVTYSKGIKNFNVRGTKYSLPLPKQGRGKDDLVLREDQLIMSQHRQRRNKTVDEDGFATFSSRGWSGAGKETGQQDIIGMGFGGGGKRNPNSRRRGAR